MDDIMLSVPHLLMIQMESFQIGQLRDILGTKSQSFLTAGSKTHLWQASFHFITSQETESFQDSKVLELQLKYVIVEIHKSKGDKTILNPTLYILQHFVMLPVIGNFYVTHI